MGKIIGYLLIAYFMAANLTEFPETHLPVQRLQLVILP
jgi:hypothetical protein